MEHMLVWDQWHVNLARFMLALLVYRGDDGTNNYAASGNYTDGSRTTNPITRMTFSLFAAEPRNTDSIASARRRAYRSESSVESTQSYDMYSTRSSTWIWTATPANNNVSWYIYVSGNTGGQVDINMFSTMAKARPAVRLQYRLYKQRRKYNP